MSISESEEQNRQSQAADTYYRELAQRALSEFSPVCELTRIEPEYDEGWVLVFSVADELGEFRVDVEPGAQRSFCKSEYSGFSYRDTDAGDAESSRARVDVAARVCELLARAEASAPPDSLRLAPVRRDGGGDEIVPDPVRHAERIELAGDCDRDCLFCCKGYERVSAEQRGDTAAARRRRGNLEILPSVLLPFRRRALRARLREIYRRTPDAEIHWNGNDALSSIYFLEASRFAHELGFREMQLQTPGGRLLDEGILDHLAACSVTKINLTAHGATARTFDHVNGKAGAYDLFWKALESLTERDFEVFVAVPCVADNVAELSDLLARLVGLDAGVEVFFWSPDEPYRDGFQSVGCSLDAAADALVRASSHFEQERVGVTGVPRCAVPASIADHYRWSFERSHHVADANFTFAESCSRCSQRADCPGLPIVYLEKFEPPSPIVG